MVGLDWSAGICYSHWRRIFVGSQIKVSESIMNLFLVSARETVSGSCFIGDSFRDYREMMICWVCLD